MDAFPALRFARAARLLGAAARASGLAVPAFRSPPRLPGTPRTIRRHPGGAVVSVQLRGRPFDAVVDDMVEGIVVANRLTGEAAARLRASLREVAATTGDGARPEAA
ncbi:MAG: hypothetical protein M5U14_17605 [Acidimicrobiia bacterium]|nr:hypothetical protein [Acidimicrobiia bacterium]